MKKTIQCQGLPCPQPVLLSKKAIEAEHPQTLEVVVDNEAARENVTRFLSSQGYDVSTASGDGLYTITGTHDGNCEVCKIMTDQELAAVSDDTRSLVFVPASVMGSGDDELGAKLMTSFLGSLKEMGPELWRVVLVNSGVQLTVEGSPSLAALKELEASGVSILVCGTCLDHFGILDKKQVGETTNMLDIITSFQLAGKIIRV